MACLVIITGSPLGKIFLLDEKNIIGRDEKMTVSIGDPSISNQHAELTQRGDTWFIKDLDSRNGTYVDFSKIAEKDLHGGEYISLGSTTLKFIVAEELEKNFYERIFEMSSRDPLTRALRRAFFLEVAAAELARSHRYKRTLTFCLIDLDHFKDCNDRYGHPGGDYLLHEWTKLIQNSIRSMDILGRLGGEEFGLVIPEQDLEHASLMIERLLSLTRSHTFQYDGHTIPLTFSAGLAMTDETTKDMQELMHRADDKLYEAKSAGRNSFKS